MLIDAWLIQLTRTLHLHQHCYDDFRNAGIAADVRNLDAEVKTSEYGSADPSPTDSSQSAPLPFLESKADTELKAEVC